MQQFVHDDRSAHDFQRPVPPNGRAGSCYAKCMIPDQCVSFASDHIIFTGDYPELYDFVDMVEVEITPSKTVWEKKRADKNCRSSNPDDCLVWCLVDQPAAYITIPVVTDTTQTDEFEVKSIEQSLVIKKGGFTEWREVLCNSNLTRSLTQQVQSTLRDLGYYHGSIDNAMDSATKAALIQYQRVNGLPIGQLDLETLSALEITY